jgi:hypothetical protein
VGSAPERVVLCVYKPFDSIAEPGTESLCAHSNRLVTDCSLQSVTVAGRAGCSTAGALHRQAQSALRASPGARAYYDEQRDRGLDHDAALPALPAGWRGSCTAA